MLRSIIRTITSSVVVLVLIATLALPAFADDYSGSYRVVTNNGTRSIMTLIQNGDTITGIYVSTNGVGRFTGHARGTNSFDFTWETRAGDAGADRATTGWGNLSFNDSGSRLHATWGYAGEGQRGTWDGQLLNP